ncbi:MAG TPA: ammonium transporter [Methanomassiliicoccales archaeon]
MNRLGLTAVLIIVVGIFVGGAAVLLPGASSGAFDSASISAGDTAWVLVAAAMVMIMTPAVGFFYGGMVRTKSVVTLINESFVILAIVSLQWILIGYSLAFGPDVGGGLIGGLNYAGLNGVGYAPNPLYAPTIPQLAYMVFQGMFAIVTPALIIGAFAERVRLKAVIVFTLIWSTLVYDPIAHWVWGAGGWAHSLGVLDFAGGSVVHASAGFSALVAVLVIGRRVGIKPRQSTPPNNIPLVLLGAALLWFGWFGFNAGSALAASPLAVSAFLVTNVAAAAGALTWWVLNRVQNRKASSMAAATGAICALATITPASGFVGPISALAIGILGGLITYGALYWITNFTHVDDTLGVWSAHGVGGLTGIVLTGLFAEVAINSAGNNGLLFGNANQLGIQVFVGLVVVAYSMLVTYAIVKAVDLIVGFRVTETEEKIGMDLTESGEKGYDESSTE